MEDTTNKLFEEQQPLTLKGKITKLRNSKKRYLIIPEGNFPNLNHGDTWDSCKKLENSEMIQIIYIFNKKELKKRSK